MQLEGRGAAAYRCQLWEVMGLPHSIIRIWPEGLIEPGLDALDLCGREGRPAVLAGRAGVIGRRGATAAPGGDRVICLAILRPDKGHVAGYAIRGGHFHRGRAGQVGDQGLYGFPALGYRARD